MDERGCLRAGPVYCAAMRSFLGLVIGVIVGAIGAVLFTQSLPPEPKSLEARVEKAEFELQKAAQEIHTLRAQLDPNRRKVAQRQAMESIGQRIRSGKRVNLDDVFKGTMKPWMRDVAPLFDRGRMVDQKRRFDRYGGELTRKYDLDDAQQDALNRWLDQQAEVNSDRITNVLENNDSGFIDFAKVMDERVDSPRYLKNLDAFMATTLDPETLSTYQMDRMTERVEHVQNEAEGRVQRLDSLVELDEDQKDQAFAIMAHSSENFDPSMQFEGLETEMEGLRPGADPNEAIKSILRPEQELILEEGRQERLADTLQEFQEVGLIPPNGWEEMGSNPF
ncbi:MAG: hypothetical protein ACI8T1_004732 [Verrucomicrobiales bacterium]